MLTFNITILAETPNLLKIFLDRTFSEVCIQFVLKLFQDSFSIFSAALKMDFTTNSVAVKRHLIDEFGGQLQDKSGTLSYGDYVDRMGAGNNGSLFEIFYLAQIVGPIEIVDGTLVGTKEKVSLLCGNNRLMIAPFKKSSKSVLRLVITTSHGRYHFNLEREDGSILNVTSHSLNENRCLLDTAAYFLAINTDKLVRRFKTFLRTNKAAREAFESGVNETLFELSCGDLKVEVDRSNQLLIRKSGSVTKEVRKKIFEEDSLEAIVRREHLNQGSPATQEIREEIQVMAGQGYEARHLFASILGGPGDVPLNFVPMLLRLSRGAYRIFEENIRYHLIKNENLFADINILVRRRPRAEIPFELEYKVGFFGADGVELDKFSEIFKNI